LKIRIQGRTRLCLLDTGCQVTIIPAQLVPYHRIVRTSIKLLAANGTRIPLLGWGTVVGYLGDTPITISGIVSEHVTDVMLGIDWLQENQASWDFVNHKVTLNGQVHNLTMKRERDVRCRRVAVEGEVVIPPESQIDIPTKVVYNSVRTGFGDEPPQVWSTEPHEIKEGLLVARTVLPDRPENLPVRVMNVTKEPIKLKKGTVIGNLDPIELVEDRPTNANERLQPPVTDPIIDEMMNRVDGSVPQHARDQLRKLLEKYSSVFSRGEWDRGWTDIVTHGIDTGSHPPIRQQMRRYPPLHLRVIDRHLENMLEQGVIEPAASPWASNIVLAKKKDGSLRCCIDFRQVNEVTRKDAYPLPRSINVSMH